MLKGSEPAETIKPSPTGAVARPEPATDSDLFQNGDESFNDHSSELQEEEEENPRKRFDNATDKHSGSERLGDERQSAELSFKEKLKQRFNKFRQEHKEVLNKNVPGSIPVTAKSFSRSSNTNNDSERTDRPKFGKRTDLIRKKLAEVLKHSSRQPEESTLERTFLPSFLRTKSAVETSRVVPTAARSLFEVRSTARFLPGSGFNRNRQFKRPEIRRNLLDKVLGKVTEDDSVKEEINEDSDNISEQKKNKTLDVEEREKEAKTTELLKDISPTKTIALTPTTSESGDVAIFQQFPVSDAIPTTPTTTTTTSLVPELEPSVTSRPAPQAGFTPLLPTAPAPLLESTLTVTEEAGRAVATIRSAYSFTEPGGGLSTRYITVTRTQQAAPGSAPSLAAQPSQINVPSSSLPADSTLEVATIYPGSDSASYLAVATIRSPYSFQVESVPSTRYITVTRTFTGIAPGTTASPPFSPSTAFVDIDTEFENQESVRRETFLPVELGFVNNNLVRPGQSKEKEEKETQDKDENFDFASLDPSFTLAPVAASSSTPSLVPSSLQLSPQQLSYLQLLQQQLPGLQEPQVSIVHTDTE